MSLYGPESRKFIVIYFVRMIIDKWIMLPRNVLY